MSEDGAGLRLLHLHSSFNPGGKELRAAKLMGAFGPGVAHTIVSGVPGALGAAAAIPARIQVAYPDDFPALTGRPSPVRYRALAEAMRGFDLVLTYNWGAINAVMAHRLFARALGLPPLVHHEDGFNQDETARLKPARNVFRRLALPGAARLVVPSRVLEGIALETWHQPRARVVRISNGIPLADFAVAALPDAVPGLVKRPDDKWVGTMAGLRAVKNLPRLVRAFAGLPEQWKLVIMGEGPERAAILTEAQRLGMTDRVHLPGHAPDPARVMGLFDLFALSSDSEQFPISVVEAMAAGLAVVSPAVGDVANMVAPKNRVWIAPPGDEAALATAMSAAASDAALRRSIGAANRELAERKFGEAAMVATYRETYGAALGRGAFP